MSAYKIAASLRSPSYTVPKAAHAGGVRPCMWLGRHYGGQLTERPLPGIASRGRSVVDAWFGALLKTIPKVEFQVQRELLSGVDDHGDGMGDSVGFRGER